MSRHIEFTANFQIPAEAVHRTLVDPGFWNHRVEKGADSGITLDHLTAGEGTIDVALAQELDTSKLPSLVSKVVKGDPSVVRGEVWGPFQDGRAEGSFSAVTTGLPVKAGGTAVLTDTAEGASLRIEGEVEVGIKIVGGAVEGMVAELIVNILRRDQEVVEEWAAAKA
ncbi:DUF2505 domain-containing protein [Rhodococcus sp. NPDC127528]|uniref:DUF2505 domain-containing protein n=1 Tax=unclassified Rhodococcus (in: high G+C Gram-positive bacteria) TaxID=192944 RepID=UPI003643235E